MLYKISSNKVLLLLVIVLFTYILAQRQCAKGEISDSKPKITTVIDTIWQTRIDTFHIQTTRYKNVYIPKIITENGSEIMIKDKQKLTEQEKHLFEEAREYQDTLRNEDIEIYSYSLLKGELLNSNLSYKLKIPREIRTTTTIEHPPSYRSGLYGFGEVGGNQNQFSNISLGLQYNRKGKWFVNYRLNFSELSNITHNLGVGIRIK